MTKLKIGGVVLSGIGAYLLISKGISALRGSVADLSEAIKWKAYYKCERPDPLAPGYERERVIQDDPEAACDGGNPPKRAKNNTLNTDLVKTIGDTITKTINDVFDAVDRGKKGLRSPEKGISEAQEEEKTYEYPYLIVKGEYLKAGEFYQKLRLKWFMGDDVAINEEDGNIVFSSELEFYTGGIQGIRNLYNAHREMAHCYNEEDDYRPDVFHICCEKYRTVAEITCVDGTYAEYVHAKETRFDTEDENLTNNEKDEDK